MRYWVFHEQMLAAALAAWEARRVREGATPEQAADDVQTVLQFLVSPEAREAKMTGGAA
jgi:hypothetical protein